MEDETSFVAIATAVGLAEREMEPRIDRYEMKKKKKTMSNNYILMSAYNSKAVFLLRCNCYLN